MARLRLLVLGSCLLFSLVPRSGHGKGIVIHGESERASQRLAAAIAREEAARKDPSEERWGEVLGAYQALLTSAGDELVPVKGQDSLLVPVRWLCHARLAALPPAALRLYRGRVDGRAAKWLAQGERDRDVRLLRRVVEESFASRAGKTALDLLGDLAFERGNFSEAAFWWRLLAPGPGEKAASFLPRYPGTPEDEARAQAKQLLARWFAGDARHPAPWRRDLEAFRQRYPEAEGHLAGARDFYWKRLKAVAATGTVTDKAAAQRDWPTFAGAASRNRVLPAEEASPEALARLCRHGHHWQLPLGKTDPGVPPLARASDFGRTLAFQPVIAGNQVLVADARFVTAYDIVTGKSERWCDVKHFSGAPIPNRELPAPADLRYTLTVAGDCVLARLGLADLRSDRKEAEAARTGGSFLVCLNRRPDDRGNRLRWRVAPAAAPGNIAFEGTAVAGDGRAYIAATRFDEGRAQTAIHCYPLNARKVAPLLWKQDVCTSRELSSDDVRYRHHLLTLAGPNVVYCSHSGVIMALDATTGRRAWAVRYRRGRSEGDKRPLAPRGLNPCVYAEGRLYVAPDDTDQLLCLDPATGCSLWRRERIEAVHLFGVGQGRLIFTTMTPRIGLRAVNAEDGGDRGGWFRTAAHGSTPLVLFGRGFLAGEQVYWPTFQRVYALGQRDGAPQDDPSLLHAIPSGNLVFGNGTLVVADRTTLHIFAPASTRLQERKTAVREQPDSALVHYYLAVAEADAGKFIHAEKNLRLAERLATPEERLPGRPLSELLRQERHDLLLRAAERAAAGKRWQEAADMLTSAAGAAFSPADRLRALARLCRLWGQADNPARAADVCRTILAEQSLHREHLPDADGNPQSARRWALDRLSELTPPDSGATVAALDKVVRQGVRAVAEVLEGGDPLPLMLPLLRSWHLTLPAGDRFLLPETGRPTDVVMAIYALGKMPDGKRLLYCHEAATGKVLWQRGVSASAAWFGRVGAGVVVAGRDKVSCLDAKGNLQWKYDAPARAGKRLPLTAFRLAASRLFFFQGSRLFALDAETGRVLWTRWGPSALTSQAAARPFATDYRVSEDTVELPELRWCLDSRTGEALADPAQGAPEVICGREPGTGKVLWKYEIPGPTTLTGEPPQVIDLSPGDRRSCLVVVSHNYGTTLQRLDNGKPRWPRPLLFRPDPVWAPGISSDADAVYFVHEGVLTAVNLDDGRKRWEHPLAAAEARGGHWRTMRAGEYVLAYPGEVRQLSFAVPLTFGCRLALVPRGDGDARFPILLCDRKTGKLVQRLNLPGSVPRLWLRWRSAGRFEDEQPTIAVNPGGLVVLLGNRAWGLSAFPQN